ncbi:MAG: chromosome partitioning protein ParA [Nevskia sp.]|nr:chromosome partitioning protein ParA [Nevskia sp.]
MKILAVYNLKGGVGKTAASVNLAYLASQSGLRTLLWDLDPQGAASWYLQANTEEIPDKSLWRAGADIEGQIQSTAYDKLHLLPADLHTRHLDTWLRKDGVRDALLQRLKPVSRRYDLVVLDCPPSLSHLADNVFTAADLVLVPTVPTHLSLRALKTVIDYYEAEGYPRNTLKPFYSMADRRRLLHRMLIEQPPKMIKDVCKTVIPYASAVERMGEHRAPLEVFESYGYAAEAYRDLWKEVNAALKKT